MNAGRESAYAAIKAAAGVKNEDGPRVLAMVAIRDGEAWNDRRLPEMGRALNAALDEIDRLAERESTLLNEFNELVGVLTEKYERAAKYCAAYNDEDSGGDYIEFEEGRREAFKWAAERARETFGGAA